MERSFSAPEAATASEAAGEAKAPVGKLDGGIRTAVGVASYLRSAIRRRGEIFRASDANDGEAEKGEAVAWEEGRVAASESDTQSSSASAEFVSPPWSATSSGVEASDQLTGHGEAACELEGDEQYAAETLSSFSRMPGASPSRYEVIYDPLNEEDGGLDDATDSEDPEEPVMRQQSDSSARGELKVEYVDVLLQADRRGLGLNVGLATKQTGDVIIVQSFRRLHPSDVGPAEACRKICIGDELHSVDGVRITSIRQLHAKVHSTPSGSFLLLRFLRTNESRVRTSSTRAYPIDEEEDQLFEEKTASDVTLDVEHAIRDNPQVAALIRGLTETNQRLQEQLLASRLKQDELNIQLDQLYSLYARTQVDSSLSSFSLSKSLRPLVWRNGSRTPDVIGDHALGIDRSLYSSKVLLEIEDAVDAEYERLRHNFELQYTIDKKQLDRRFAEKVKELEATASKKIAMLQAGYEHVARRFENMAEQSTEPKICRCCSSEGAFPAKLSHEESIAKLKLEQIKKIVEEHKHQQAERDIQLLELELQESKAAPRVASVTDFYLRIPKSQDPGASTCAA